MISQKEVEQQYLLLFGISKNYYDILKECHQQIKSFESAELKFKDFKSDEQYTNQMKLINDYRKYAKLDDYLLGLNDMSLIPLSDVDNFSHQVTYHDIVESIDLFDDTFHEHSFVYIPKSQQNINNIKRLNVLTVDDIFAYNNEQKFTLYYIESSKKYYFGSLIDGYEYLYKLPFEKIDLKDNEESRKIYGYLYLINEYIFRHYSILNTGEVYTTLFNEYGLTLEDYLQKPKSSNRMVVYNNNLRPFLIEPEGLLYYPQHKSLDFDFSEEDKKKKRQNLFEYYTQLKFDKEKAEKYVRDNWIINYDIGRVYGINYNLIDTSEKLNKYKEDVVEQKLSDIELNFKMYKEHGLMKYSPEKFQDIDANKYSSCIQDYLSSFKTNKKHFEI